MKSLIRFIWHYLAYIKTRLLFKNLVMPGSKFSLTSDVRYSILRGSNYIGKRSTVHKCVLDEYSYVGDDCRLINVNIGKFTSLGSAIKTSFGNHPYHFISQHPATYSIGFNMPSFAKAQLYDSEHDLTLDKSYVSIGNDVWVGDDVSILDGVSIGHGAVVGANSLVTQSIPPYAIVAGSPAKIIKHRFTEEDIETLLRIQWWEWDKELIQQSVNNKLFCGSVKLLEEFYESQFCNVQK